MIKTEDILKQMYSTTKIQIMCWVLKYPEGITVSKIVELTGLNRTNISKQINNLKAINLLNDKKDGKNIIYTLTDDLVNEQEKMLKSIINSFHYVDEGKKDHEFYK